MNGAWAGMCGELYGQIWHLMIGVTLIALGLGMAVFRLTWRERGKTAKL